jgi:mannose-6-phosphate isomerase-like protein (cupin superfamily)
MARIRSLGFRLETDPVDPEISGPPSSKPPLPLSVVEFSRRKMVETDGNDQRPWGFFEVLGEAGVHKVKRITLHPGQRLSLQSHRYREEHWVVVSGEAVVTLDKREIVLGPGGSVDIPREAPHRIRNPGSDPLVFIEVQLGEYLEEDDIVRLEDDYGRPVTD